VCPNCATVLPTGARVWAEPGDRRDVVRELPATPDAAAAARRVVVGLPLGADTRADLELLASELVTNAVRYGGRDPRDPITIRIANTRDRLRLAVHDSGPGFAPPARNPAAESIAGGRGCVIVDALAAAWGVERDADGCTVWCDVVVADESERSADRDTAGVNVQRFAMDMADPSPSQH
jgi:anti-sigma regulatory factor (Ser/Thr protein kinase)